MKSESHWPKGLRGNSILSKLYTFFFYIFSSGGNIVCQSETNLAILVEGTCNLRNIPRKFK